MARNLLFLGHSTDKTRVEVFVARQPVFDRQLQIYGYELLYRSDPSRNQFDGTEATSATQQLISSTLLSVGLDKILCGKKAFVNFNERLLRDGVYQSLPREDTVIEILESVEPSADLIALCRAIRNEGATCSRWTILSPVRNLSRSPVAQSIKIDLQTTGKAEQERLLRKYRPRRDRHAGRKI